MMITEGNKSGMLNTAISVMLLLVFDAIADTTVNMLEKLAVPKTMTKIKWL